MDTQRKKGVLEVCVLSVLKRGPSYGYQIIQDVSDCIEVKTVRHQEPGKDCWDAYIHSLRK